jgi:hypothetical protein
VKREKQRRSLLDEEDEEAAAAVKDKGVPKPGIEDDDGDGGVDVLGFGAVSGLDYVVLKGDKAAALKGWLDRHGFATRPDLEKWVARYVAAGWFLTAFRLAEPNAEGKANWKREGRFNTLPQFRSTAVRMSFRADRPFFPYLEPDDQRELRRQGLDHSRQLRVFYVGTKRVDGKIDDGGGELRWPGRAVHAGELDEEQRQTIAARVAGKKAGPVALPEGAYLTEFVDVSPSRPRGDLYFSPSADQRPLVRPPIVRYRTVYEAAAPSWGTLVAVGLVVVVFGGLGLVLWRLMAARGGGNKSDQDHDDWDERAKT